MPAESTTTAELGQENKRARAQGPEDRVPAGGWGRARTVPPHPPPHPPMPGYGASSES